MNHKNMCEDFVKYSNECLMYFHDGEMTIASELLFVPFFVI